jgi:hypothetical protein
MIRQGTVKARCEFIAKANEYLTNHESHGASQNTALFV